MSIVRYSYRARPPYLNAMGIQTDEGLAPSTIMFADPPIWVPATNSSLGLY